MITCLADENNNPALKTKVFLARLTASCLACLPACLRLSVRETATQALASELAKCKREWSLFLKTFAPAIFLLI